jgi:hypothetical protein
VKSEGGDRMLRLICLGKSAKIVCFPSRLSDVRRPRDSKKPLGTNYLGQLFRLFASNLARLRRIGH